MEGHCTTGQCPHWAVVPMEEEEEEEEEESQATLRECGLRQISNFAVNYSNFWFPTPW